MTKPVELVVDHDFGFTTHIVLNSERKPIAVSLYEPKRLEDPDPKNLCLKLID